MKDTRVEVAHIVADSEYRGLSAEDIAAGFDHISLAAVHAALAYYHANREEVYRMMQEDDLIIAAYRKPQGGQQGNSEDVCPVSSSRYSPRDIE